jgi:predicted nucleic acid-binding protein
MLYLLDTSVIIDLLRNNDGAAKNFVLSHIDDEILTSTICEAEITEGLYYETQTNYLQKETLKMNCLHHFP